MENNLPVIYLVDSAGVFLPMQDEIFPDKEHFGKVFRNNAKMSAMGITQIAAVMGSCVAGGAYLPIMSDETLMVENNGSIYLHVLITKHRYSINPNDRESHSPQYIFWKNKRLNKYQSTYFETKKRLFNSTKTLKEELGVRKKNKSEKLFNKNIF